MLSEVRRILPTKLAKQKVLPIKNQLYSPSIPNYVREQMFAQLRTGLKQNVYLSIHVNMRCVRSWYKKNSVLIQMILVLFALA